MDKQKHGLRAQPSEGTSKINPCGDDEIGTLLRLKRYEQPPPGYFENFLREFRRRRCGESLLYQQLDATELAIQGSPVTDTPSNTEHESGFAKGLYTILQPNDFVAESHPVRDSLAAA